MTYIDLQIRITYLFSVWARTPVSQTSTTSGITVQFCCRCPLVGLMESCPTKTNPTLKQKFVVNPQTFRCLHSGQLPLLCLANSNYCGETQFPNSTSSAPKPCTPALLEETVPSLLFPKMQRQEGSPYFSLSQ